MQCPRKHSRLYKHTRSEKSRILTYWECPVYSGLWFDQKNAELLRPHDFIRRTRPTPKNQGEHFSCPVCNKTLYQLNEKTIPDTIAASYCPEFHGYFFGGIEIKSLSRSGGFLSHPPSVLRTSRAAIMLCLAGMLVSGYAVFSAATNLGVVSQSVHAQNIITAEQTIQNTQDGSVTFLVTTSVPSRVTIQIGSDTANEKLLRTNDSFHHYLLMMPGVRGLLTYQYTIALDDTTIRTPPERITIP